MILDIKVKYGILIYDVIIINMVRLFLDFKWLVNWFLVFKYNDEILVDNDEIL